MHLLMRGKKLTGEWILRKDKREEDRNLLLSEETFWRTRPPHSHVAPLGVIESDRSPASYHGRALTSKAGLSCA
jgi:hypothetical protein